MVPDHQDIPMENAWNPSEQFVSRCLSYIFHMNVLKALGCKSSQWIPCIFHWDIPMVRYHAFYYFMHCLVFLVSIFLTFLCVSRLDYYQGQIVCCSALVDVPVNFGQETTCIMKFGQGTSISFCKLWSRGIFWSRDQYNFL